MYMVISTAPIQGPLAKWEGEAAELGLLLDVDSGSPVKCVGQHQYHEAD